MVAGHDAAPEGDVDVTSVGGRLPFRREPGHRRRRRDAVERHVDDRGHAAGRGRARRGVEPFPLGASGLVDVDVGVDNPR